MLTIEIAKKEYFCELILSKDYHQKAIFGIVDSLMKTRIKATWPDHEYKIELAEEFSKYFVITIDDIRCELDANTRIVDND